jgi:uncharacterized Fe-S center protein
MPQRIPYRRHSTAYMHVNTRACRACWECLARCRRRVLAKADFLWHRHARIVAAERCTGCGRCAAACRHGAITIMHESKEMGS